MRLHDRLVALLTTSAVTMTALATGCGRREGDAPPAPAPSAAVTTTGGPSAAQEALDRMDTRIPVPLLPMMANHQKQNMRDHLLAVQEIVVAIAASDFAAVEQAAARIGYSQEMGQMCEHMGAGAPGFTQQALAFHHTADTIIEAARQQDRDAVIQALGSTLQTCTGCHEAYRQSVVDESAWQRLTSSSAPTGHAPGQ
jgi:hypothetical protein